MPSLLQFLNQKKKTFPVGIFTSNASDPFLQTSDAEARLRRLHLIRWIVASAEESIPPPAARSHQLMTLFSSLKSDRAATRVLLLLFAELLLHRSDLSPPAAQAPPCHVLSNRNAALQLAERRRVFPGSGAH